MIEPKKLVELENGFRVLEQSKSLIPTGAKVSVVSVLGASSKPTLIKTNSKNTTKRIYISRAGNKCTWTAKESLKPQS